MDVRKKDEYMHSHEDKKERTPTAWEPRQKNIYFVPPEGDHPSKEASRHILERGMKKERPLIAGTKKNFFIVFNQTKKRELEQNSNLQGTSAQSLDDSQESICLQEKPPVYQSIGFHISWFPKQESMLGFFQAQTQSGKHVSLYEVGLTFTTFYWRKWC